MSRAPQQWRWLTVTIMIMGTIWGGVLGGGPESAQPDFTHVTDILNGRRHLLRTDDLVVGIGAPGVISPGQNSGRKILFTEDSKLSDRGFRGFNVIGNFSAPVVAGARMFDTPYDVAVTAVYERQTHQLYWFLDVPPALGILGPSGVTPLPPVVQDPGSFLTLATADVTGDGYDEVVVFLAAFDNRDGAAIVGTAANPQNPS
jgi:hypothetical protein